MKSPLVYTYNKSCIGERDKNCIKNHGKRGLTLVVYVHINKMDLQGKNKLELRINMSPLHPTAFVDSYVIQSCMD